MAGLLLTGGSGRLGQAIRRLTDCAAPSSKELNIVDLSSCLKALDRYRPETVLHCAALADTVACQIFQQNAYSVNVLGTRNVALACKKFGVRLVYVSSEYVFSGASGNYHESSAPNPCNFYGLTKLLGEYEARFAPSWLVVRAPFCQDPPWPYANAFVDQWTSRIPVSARAPQILKAALSKFESILHIGGPRRSVFDLACSLSPVGSPPARASIEAILSCSLPADVSLIDRKWKEFIS